MTEDKLYKVEEFVTTGYSTKLNKEQATALLDELINEGTNPKRLRAIPDTTPTT